MQFNIPNLSFFVLTSTAIFPITVLATPSSKASGSSLYARNYAGTQRNSFYSNGKLSRRGSSQSQPVKQQGNGDRRENEVIVNIAHNLDANGHVAAHHTEREQHHKNVAADFKKHGSIEAYAAHHEKEAQKHRKTAEVIGRFPPSPENHGHKEQALKSAAHHEKLASKARKHGSLAAAVDHHEKKAAFHANEKKNMPARANEAITEQLAHLKAGQKKRN